MSKNTSIALDNHFEEFISTRIHSGRFNSASEVIRAGLRLLENEELKIQAINNALLEGEKSGFVKDFDSKSTLEKIRKKHL